MEVYLKFFSLFSFIYSGIFFYSFWILKFLSKKKRDMGCERNVLKCLICDFIRWNFECFLVCVEK